MILRGILDRSFGNILCLRGFAPLINLAKISYPDESYQREEDVRHCSGITEFLDSGEYTFFPEVVLGGSMQRLGFAEETIANIYKAVNEGESFTKTKAGAISLSLFSRAYKHGQVYDYSTIGSFYELKGKVFSRIDGNHRLQAIPQAKVQVQNYNAPFCLILFRYDEELLKFGRVFFHMINFRALPMSEEKNLQLILTTDDYSDNRLLRSPFGKEFFLAKRLIKDDAFSASLPVPLSYKTLVGFLKYLVEEIDFFDLDMSSYGSIIADIQTNAKTVKDLSECARNLLKLFKRADDFIRENHDVQELCRANDSVVVSLMVLLLRGSKEFKEYVTWLCLRIREGNLRLKEMSFEDLLREFDYGRESRHRTIFVSMQFGSCGTEQNFETIKEVAETINHDYRLAPPLKIVRIDQKVTGETFEINEQVINQVSQCGYLIADLTYCNSNVYHEIGMIMGRTLALTGKHEYNMALILDKQVSEENKIVKFNLKSLQHFAFSNQKELATGIRERIEKFYRL